MRPVMETMESRVLFSAAPVLTSTQKADLEKIGHDLSVMHANSQVTSAEIKALTTDLTSIAKVAHAPSTSSVAKLKTDAKAAFSDKKITPVEEAQLIKDTQAVVASMGVPTSLAQQTAADTKAIIVSSGVTETEVKGLVTDVTAFLSTFK